MTEATTPANDGQRGKTDHHVRDQIVTAATAHFSHYGYGKTTVSDLAKAIGFSKAYIYKFYDSKQAIGEAICANFLSIIMQAAYAAAAGDESATERYRRVFRALVSTSTSLFFSDRKLYDIAAVSTSEHWHSHVEHEQKLTELMRRLVLDGRETGEFERKTPIDEVCRAMLLAMQPFLNPLMLQYNLDLVDAGGPMEICNLILRSLAP